jgi:hypothetical protein
MPNFNRRGRVPHLRRSSSFVNTPVLPGWAHVWADGPPGLNAALGRRLHSPELNRHPTCRRARTPQTTCLTIFRRPCGTEAGKCKSHADSTRINYLHVSQLFSSVEMTVEFGPLVYSGGSLSMSRSRSSLATSRFTGASTMSGQMLRMYSLAIS